MTRIKLFTVLSILLSLSGFAQKTLVLGYVYDKENKPVENVHIKVENYNYLAKSNQKGYFKLQLPKNQTFNISLSHIKYKTIYHTFQTDSLDSLSLSFNLTEKTYQLPEVNINETNKPVKVYSSVTYNIGDFEFYKDNFLVIAYEKKMDKDSKLFLIDENGIIIDKHFIPGEPKELYTDYLGHINLIENNSIYRVVINEDKIDLIELPTENFYQLIKPCIDTLGGNILLSDFLYQFPQFKYYHFNPKDTTFTVLKEIEDKDLAWQYYFEYYNLTNAQKQYAKRLAQKIKGYDKHDIAALMTGFAYDFMYEPLYAPMFVYNDTVLIFDHYANHIYTYTNDTVLTDSIPIHYHQNSKGMKWKKQLFMDEINGKIYALFQKNGYYYLIQINRFNGKEEHKFKLYYKYVEKIKIKDDIVYYTYKPSSSLQKKFLYKEYIK
ncbi:MAG: hypothetical protein Kow0079_12670 [Vicingaceae bacterium]